MRGDTDSGTRFQLHGTTIALMAGDGLGWVAAMIRGPSGSGKSDLALRCLAQPLGSLFPGIAVQSGVRLVADDRTDLSAMGHTTGVVITASAPPAIVGLLEVRGLGIIGVPHITTAQLVVVVDLVLPSAVPRLPAPVFTPIGPLNRPNNSEVGQHIAHLPRIMLSPFEASSPLKLLLALVRTALSGSPVGADAAKHHHLPEGQ